MGLTDEPGIASKAEPVAAGGRVRMLVIAREWARIGCVGFGGPPAHISLLRKLCVERRGWLSADEFEDGVATTNLLPGPASTQLAIYCAWRLGGPAGAIVGGACFIVPGLVVILALSALFIARHPPLWVEGAAAGAGAAVPAVALQAALSLAPASWRRATNRRLPESVTPALPARRALPGPAGARWIAYLAVGGIAGAIAGPYLALVLAACGALELVIADSRGAGRAELGFLPPVAIAVGASAGAGVLLSVAWVALKVGALSYGGGFVIIPLIQHDVVHAYHWMTGAQFLSAVALGQVTPGPVVQTVAVVGYAAAGVVGGLLASFVAFLPSFVFVLVGASRFGLLRRNAGVKAFLTGAGPAAIGAIAGSTIPLGLELAHLWQLGLLGLDLIWLLALRRNVVVAIGGAAAIGVIAALAGAPVG